MWHKARSMGHPVRIEITMVCKSILLTITTFRPSSGFLVGLGNFIFELGNLLVIIGNLLVVIGSHQGTLNLTLYSVREKTFDMLIKKSVEFQSRPEAAC